jgi:hypothetical protein
METQSMVHAKATTKAAMITKILWREKGATTLEMAKATGWQPHSCRAFLTGVRKKFLLGKEQRPDGKLAYRILGDPSVLTCEVFTSDPA